MRKPLLGMVAATLALQSGAQFEVTWKDKAGSTRRVGASEMIEVGLAVQQYVAGCFVREAELAADLGDHHVAQAEGHLAVRRVEHPGARLVARNVEGRGGVGHGFPSVKRTMVCGVKRPRRPSIPANIKFF